MSWDEVPQMVGRLLSVESDTHGTYFNYKPKRYHKDFSELLSTGKMRFVINYIGVHMARFQGLFRTRIPEEARPNDFQLV